MPVAGTALELIAQLIGSRQQVFVFEEIEHSVCRSAGERITGECAAQAARSRSVHNFGTTGYSSKRESAAKGFGCHKNVGLDAVALAGEHGAGAAEA